MSLCPLDNPNWSYFGLTAEEIGAIEPRLVHCRTEEIADEEVEREVMTPVEREIIRTIETPIAEFVDAGVVNEDGEPILCEVQLVEISIETVVEMVEEPRMIEEFVQRSVPLEMPVAEGIMSCVSRPVPSVILRRTFGCLPWRRSSRRSRIPMASST